MRQQNVISRYRGEPLRLMPLAQWRSQLYQGGGGGGGGGPASPSAAAAAAPTEDRKRKREDDDGGGGGGARFTPGLVIKLAPVAVTVRFGTIKDKFQVRRDRGGEGACDGVSGARRG